MVKYKELTLMKGSTALALWDDWQKAKSDRNVFQKKLDDHLKDVNRRDAELKARGGDQKVVQ